MPCLPKQCATLSRLSSPKAISSVRTENRILGRETLLNLSFLSTATSDFSNVLHKHCVTRLCFIWSRNALSLDLVEVANIYRSFEDLLSSSMMIGRISLIYVFSSLYTVVLTKLIFVP